MKKTVKQQISGLGGDIVCTVIGCALMALAIAVFNVPNDITPGGVSGLATALARILPVSVGTLMLVLNVPLLLAAWKMLGRRTLVMTLIATGALSAFVDLFGMLIAGYSGDRLLAAIAGGTLTGLGVGVLLQRGISTGGTDLLALLLRKPLPNLRTGTLMLLIDTSVVAFAVLVFRDIEVAMYSAISIFIISKLVDAIAQGVDYAKVIYTVTEDGNEISRVLNEQADRGTTIVRAQGGYAHGEKQIVITVARRNSLTQILRLIKETDPNAFTFVTDSTEVHGQGFKVQ